MSSESVFFDMDDRLLSDLVYQIETFRSAVDFDISRADSDGAFGHRSDHRVSRGADAGV